VNESINNMQTETDVREPA